MMPDTVALSHNPAGYLPLSHRSQHAQLCSWLNHIMQRARDWGRLPVPCSRTFTKQSNHKSRKTQPERFSVNSWTGKKARRIKSFHTQPDVFTFSSVTLFPTAGFMMSQPESFRPLLPPHMLTGRFLHVIFSINNVQGEFCFIRTSVYCVITFARAKSD